MRFTHCPYRLIEIGQWSYLFRLRSVNSVPLNICVRSTFPHTQEFRKRQERESNGLCDLRVEGLVGKEGDQEGAGAKGLGVEEEKV